MSKSGDHQTVDRHFNMVFQSELPKNVSHMMFDHGWTDAQTRRDLLVGPAEGNKTQDSIFCVARVELGFAHRLSPQSLRVVVFMDKVTDYLITLSARANTFGGIVRLICFAPFRLMMNSNFLGCSTGSSAGLAPFRILST
jgi:hypothetical protein